MIPFNKHAYTGSEFNYIEKALLGNKLSGDGPYGNKCQEWFIDKLGCITALLTPSCTAALELAAMLIDIHPGDEIIMPSFTFVSTANAFVLRGAKIVFVDIRPDTMNIDESLIENAITAKTKAIVPVHYAGVACEMDVIMELAIKYNLYVIEDAAQAMMSSYKNKALGTFGNIGTYSFHETKNITSGGEGGLLIVNDPDLRLRAEILREKGTNRVQFFRGQVDKYTWIDIGSSYLPSELQAAYLWAQLESANEITAFRLARWKQYYEALERCKYLELPNIKDDYSHNGHIFYIKTRCVRYRDLLINSLRNEYSIDCVFHYVPLHSAPAASLNSRFSGNDVHTTKESLRLIRLPIWYGISQEQVEYISKSVISAITKIATSGL